MTTERVRQIQEAIDDDEAEEAWRFARGLPSLDDEELTNPVQDESEFRSAQ